MYLSFPIEIHYVYQFYLYVNVRAPCGRERIQVACYIYTRLRDMIVYYYVFVHVFTATTMKMF